MSTKNIVQHVKNTLFVKGLTKSFETSLGVRTTYRVRYTFPDRVKAFLGIVPTLEQKMEELIGPVDDRGIPVSFYD